MKHDVPRAQEAAPMWQAAAEGRLVLPYCAHCTRYVWPPRDACRGCGNELHWRDASGAGAIETYSIVRRAVDPALKDSVPYVVALVALDEGVRIFSNIVGTPVEGIRIGLRVQCSFERASDDATWLPVFTPEG